MEMNVNQIFESDNPRIYHIRTSFEPDRGKLPLSAETFRDAAGGTLFGAIQNAGMGMPPTDVHKKHFLILSTLGGMRTTTGRPVALGYHTGHFELDALVRAAADTLRHLDVLPFAGFVSDPCDGRTQGTPGMMDSLAYRNDAALVFRRLIRSLPTRRGVLGIATCDKGMPAMMMALAAMADLPCVLVPGGVTLPSRTFEDLGRIQSVGARFARGEVTLDYAQEQACGACASPGGGCHFLGTAATLQLVGEALGLSLPHSALAPSGEPIWKDTAGRSAKALVHLEQQGITIKDIITPAALYNAMVTFAAFGGSTNLLLHLPAIAHAARLKRPTVSDWIKVNKKVPRLVSVLPNGPIDFPTCYVFLAGGVPEVMLHLRDLHLLHLDTLTVTGRTLGENLAWWEQSDRRVRLKNILQKQEKIDPDDVIFSVAKAKSKGLTGSITFPTGNLAPEGCLVKSAAIDPSVLDAEGVYKKTGSARVYTSERAAIAAIKNGDIQPGNVMILICIGPLGSGMEETFQVTAALKYLSWGKHAALITDGRFSGVSTGACIGHVGPEALAGGPIGKVVDGDIIEICIDTINLVGRVNLVGDRDTAKSDCSVAYGSKLLNNRTQRPDLKPQPGLPDDTRLWAALQNVSGGTWGGCVYDVEYLVKMMNYE